MIRRIYSPDLPTFKALTFGAGLNILLAEKSKGATDKQTRNRAGKSSMVELVHFLLGSNAGKESLFRVPALSRHTFALEFDLAGAVTRVKRKGEKPSRLEVEGDFSSWPMQPKTRDGVASISNEPWKTVLARMMFGLEEHEGSWSPSFRSLLTYFARRERDGGFHSATQQSSKQHVADLQVNISYLLGLDWTIPQAWQRIREQEKTLTELRKSLRAGAFGQVVDTAASLKTRHVVAQARAGRLKKQVASFKVVAEYHTLEREASEFTRQLGTLADENTLDRRYIAEIEQTTVAEVAPAPEDLHQLYAEVGIVLPDLVRQRFDAVQTFHEAVVRNRRSYLEAELAAAKQRVVKREAEQRRLDARRAEIMGMLQSAGALEHFAALQGELARAEAEVDSLRLRHETAEALESGSLNLKMQRSHLQRRLHEDYSEQVAVVDEAILTFQQISSALYEDSSAGSLTMTPTANGPDFAIQIHGAKSRGVSNMKVFCFDMMLTLLALKRGRSPGFLIHDSHLFDGVDERQVGKALALGAELARTHGFQYIVTLNTDGIPRMLPPGFEVEDHAMEVRLSDATDEGGLFGFRFD